MDSNPLLFRDLTYIFMAAVIGGMVAWRLRLPLIIGFVLGGIAISPFTPGPHLSELHSFEVFAEVGVVLLMFSIGVEFSIPDLMRVKWVALLGAPIGILFTLGLAIAVGKLAGWSTTEGIVVGAAVSVASTMVLARLLTDTGKMTETYGRVMIGITLMEDLAVICMTVVIPVFSRSGDGSLQKAAWTLGKALLLLIPLVFLAIKVIPRVLRRVKLMCNPELFLLVAIAVCLGAAALAQAVGFSVALGAFLAGLSISGLEDLHDAHTQLVPLRDAFVALFFVSLGTLIEPEVLWKSLPLLGWMLLLIVLGKFLVWTTVVWLFRLSFLDRNSGGFWADPDWRAFLCGRASGTIVGNGGRKCFQHGDRGVLDFHIAKCFHRPRCLRVAEPKVSRDLQEHRNNWCRSLIQDMCSITNWTTI
jgi:monovalent cation:H+ antiporter-2, CPA2 family